MAEKIILSASLLHYGILVLFGVALTAMFSGIPKTRKNTAILLICATVLIAIELAFFVFFGVETVTKLYPLITHLPLILFFVIFYKKSPFPVILSITITYLCCQIINWIELIAKHFGVPTHITDISASLLLILLAYFVNAFFAESIARLLLNNGKELTVYAIIPFAYYIYDYLVTVYTDLIDIPNVMAIEFMPFVISLAYLIFSVVYHRQYEAHFEAKQKSQILSMQLKQYESIQARIEETRRASHDLRQHLRLITAYIENGDTAALAEYVKRYGESLPDNIERRFCDNTVADTVVRFYAVKAEENGIKFDVNLHLPSVLNINEPDLCVLLGNLLENALDECLRHTEEPCTIKLSGQLRGTRTLIITVDNTPASKPIMSDGVMISSKGTRNEGIGTYSIKNIAKEYGGEAKFEWKDGTFYASVVLVLPYSQTNHEHTDKQ